eukprot:m.205423 g.205423  ORF g.205423 m.205423 type:complete len:67 (+) comp18487_c0_seq4:250-450(+)
MGSAHSVGKKRNRRSHHAVENEQVVVQDEGATPFVKPKRQQDRLTAACVDCLLCIAGNATLPRLMT